MYEKEIVTANTVKKPSGEAVEELAELLRRNTNITRNYLLEVAHNYRFLITLKEADRSIEICKIGTEIVVETRSVSEIQASDYDIEFSSRYSYVRRALTQRYGNEVLFVGSGGIFKYRDNAQARENLHRELVTLLCFHEQPPSSRFGNQSKVLYLIKQKIKAIIGRTEFDYYDLNNWINSKT